MFLEAFPSRSETPRRFSHALLMAFIVLVAIASLWGVHTWLSQPGTLSPLTASMSLTAVSPGNGNPPSLFPASFSVEEIEKEDSYAGGHSHAVVKLGDQALFMIRDEGRYPTTADRARAIANNLRRALENLKRDPRATFRLEASKHQPTIVQVRSNSPGAPPLVIVTILHDDVIAYNRRSHRHVTVYQLGQWWLNRLEDRFDLFVKGRRPTRTIRDQDGKLLVELFDKAKARSPDGMLTANALYETLRQFPPGQRWLLAYEGVRRIPDYEEHP